MRRFTTTDALSGLLLVLVGAAFTIYCYQHYTFGSLRRVGPGMFPVLVGLTMMLCGAICTAVAVIRGTGTNVTVEPRSLAAVMASLAVFALLIRSAGVVPAVFAMTLVSGLAQQKPNFLKLAILGIVLAAFAAGLFGVVLGISAPLIAWPF